MVSMGQTITVVNKSGKIVSNSKHIVNVFKEAKSAYREKKAELRQEREAEIERQLKEQARQKKKQQYALEDDTRSVTSSRSGHSHASRRSSTSHRSHRSHRDDGHRSGSHRSHASRPTVERGFSDGFAEPADVAPSGPRRASTQRFQPTSPLKNSYTMDDIEQKELTRRKSESDGLALMQTHHESVPRRDEVDMDLAYGEMPPAVPTKRVEDEQELRQKMTTLQRMLEEANCMQHSATAIIKNLEGNPEAMAAVALTLAEVSNLASKLAPGALLSLKGAFPAVVALLVSPEFLIAGGVAVGVTVIAFGGYKIIKKMKAKKALEGEKGKELLIADEVAADNDDLESVHSLDRIEQWRRGIELDESVADTPGTSVEGEYITPGAASQLRSEGKLGPKKDKATRDKERKQAEKDKKEKAKREKADKEDRKARDKAEKKMKEKESKRDKKSVFSSKRSEVVGDYI